MKHSIRERIVDPIRGQVVKISTINAELGTGLLDKNGKEIFEGDIVKYMYQYELYGEPCEYPETVTVEFVKGAFITGDDYLHDFIDNCKGDVEIVGHVEDAK